MRRCRLHPVPALAAAAVLLPLSGCGPAPEGAPLEPARPAAPAVADVRWRESYGPRGRALRFEVDRITVTRNGWSATVAVANDTRLAWRVEPQDFGLMLFGDGDLEALEEAARRGGLPPPRRARELTPAPPAALEAGSRWRGTIAAPGALAAGSFVRVVFGRFSAVGEPPEGMEPRVVWITDHAHRLPGG